LIPAWQAGTTTLYLTYRPTKHQVTKAGGIDSLEPIPKLLEGLQIRAQEVNKIFRAGIFKKSMGARHRGEIGFSYRPARLQAGGTHSLESIPGPHKHLKVRAQNETVRNPDDFGR
jgi:hypothetical protein